MGQTDVTILWPLSCLAHKYPMRNLIDIVEASEPADSWLQYANDYDYENCDDFCSSVLASIHERRGDEYEFSSETKDSLYARLEKLKARFAASGGRVYRYMGLSKTDLKKLGHDIGRHWTLDPTVYTGSFNTNWNRGGTYWVVGQCTDDDIDWPMTVVSNLMFGDSESEINPDTVTIVGVFSEDTDQTPENNLRPNLVGKVVRTS